MHDDAPLLPNDRRPARPSILITSHPGAVSGRPVPLNWGASDQRERGPIIAGPRGHGVRNAIGTHSGAYSLYRALAVAAGQLKPEHRPDLTDTAPAVPIGPFAQWRDPDKIISLDPWGHMVADGFGLEIAAGLDIRPSIAVAGARMKMPEIVDALRAERLSPDGAVVADSGDVRVTKIAIEPVWMLAGVARRFGVSEQELRCALFEHAGGMFPELVTRPDLKVFLPPIGGTTVYLFGDAARLGREETVIACRVHDECNGSDVFGSDICTCRPYLAHGVEVCIRTAQDGGVGVIVYNRKEGRALGEVTKFLVYNARKRQAGGDRAEAYFQRTECIAGVQDMRFQELMPDVLHWLGIARIDRLVSMSNLKYQPIVNSGIEVVQRVPIPEELIPDDARVEMDAKKAAGYYTDAVPDSEELKKAKDQQLEG